jgi:hypothetical protein
MAELALGQRQRDALVHQFESAALIRRPARYSTTISALMRWPWRSWPGLTHHGDNLIDGRWVGWVALALVARRDPRTEAGCRRWRAMSPGGVKQRLNR